ncbi:MULTISPECIES: ABC transporter substrate-binding protein [Paraburkholderia]|uniref:Amino acid ABC transporter substrate-binding protein, PAAT family (TC 3.A.1.3.-) n=2 Tax=Paraburkholderia TaxID=1822464 RepID=A0A7Z7FHR3_9BURK|nr:MULTISPECIES: ABC transporter substrate-binding protein [Paraburkholderia]AUT60119.1 ABC transporter substrate-binding protein [Paraburkholderia terrae]BCZ78540.1 ABC transporter substrate-binding protein [Paraburkholderia terrae]BDC39027.1 ABC transporter substrate-binding protein [Paraburkholderia terrae]SDI04398.1 amino acid ABC transporter substrate-binding protein, PAAT family (TC 3.A.1.3.-) [Paraburkholderia steynii]
MKKYALCVALAVMASGAAAKEWKTVRIGVDASYPPFESVAPSGQMVGFDVDLTRALCAKMNVRCVWIPQDLDGIIPALKAKKFDIIVSSLTVTDKRREQIDFSDRLFDAPARMIAKKGSPLLPTVESLKGKHVGVEQGSTQEAYAKAYWEPKGVTIVPYQNQDQVYADLATGRLDAALQDELQADAGFLKTPRGKDFAWAGPEVKDPKTLGEGTAIGVRKEDGELKAKLNKALAEVHQDGTFTKLEKQYFDVDIDQSR